MEAQRQLDDTVLIVANGGSNPPSSPKSNLSYSNLFNLNAARL